MTAQDPQKVSPDAQAGIALSLLEEQKPFVAHFGDEDIILVREGTRVFAVGAKCSHYGGPLSQGRVSKHGIHCPWHHACFSLSDGHVTRAPGIEPIASYRVEIKDGLVRVLGREKTTPGGAPGPHPKTITIVGGGGAGYAALRRLRQLGFKGSINVFAAEGQAPYDRTKLSKGYLAGKAGRGSLPLANASAPEDLETHFHLSQQVVALDTEAKSVTTNDGQAHAYHALLLATGATPKEMPQQDGPTVPVHVLRSLDDADALVALAAPKAKVVIVGAGFIGLEAAGSLRQQGLDVCVLTPDAKPLDGLLGATLGQAIRAAHAQAGVTLRLGASFEKADATGVWLTSGDHIPCDFVLAGIGVVPNDSLAKKAGIKTDSGILVDSLMRTSAPQVFAAGDVARVNLGDRIEHWAVALGQAQVAAANILGSSVTYQAPAFFWTEHFGIKVRYVGHASGFDEAQEYGSMNSGRFAVALRKSGRTRAIVTVGCDEISLGAEACFEANDEAGIVLALEGCQAA